VKRAYMHTIKLIKYALLIVLTSNFVSYGMSGDRGGTGPGIPRGSYVPALPGIPADPQTDPAVAQALDKIARELKKKQEAQEKETERVERSVKRRRIGKEEDTGQQPQPREAPSSSTTTTTTTTTTSTTSTQQERENAQGSGLAESQLPDLRTIQERAAPEDVEEWFSGFLPQIENTLFRRDPNLVNSIAQRFLDRDITLDELNTDTISRSPYIVRLSVRAGRNRQITQEQIQLIGQRFPNLRELVLSRVGLKSKELRALSQQQIARNLIRLDISGNALGGGDLDGISNFTNLKRLDVGHNKIGNKGFKAIAGAPFAHNLTWLGIRATNITTNGVQANIAAFVNLTTFDITGNSIQDAGLEAIARAPFARNLTWLGIAGETAVGTKITTKGVQANIAAFRNLRSLIIGNNNIGDAGLEAIARAPFARNLTELDVLSNGITASGVQANIAAFAKLEALFIAANNIGDAGLEAIARAPFAGNLLLLVVLSNGITTSGVQANIAAFAKLKSLIIGNNNIGDAGLEAIARAPFASNLLTLVVAATGITTSGVQANIAAFAKLTALVIGNNNIGDAGLEAIARAPFARNLSTLVVAATGITAEGVRDNIAKFIGLRGLNISCNAIGDAGLEAIARAPFAAKLLTLNVKKSGITKAGVNATVRAFLGLTNYLDF